MNVLAMNMNTACMIEACIIRAMNNTYVYDVTLYDTYIILYMMLYTIIHDVYDVTLYDTYIILYTHGGTEYVACLVSMNVLAMNMNTACVIEACIIRVLAMNMNTACMSHR